MSEIMNCGCGGEAKAVNSVLTGWMVICGNCHTASWGHRTEAEAIEAWNKAMGAKDINVLSKFADDNNVGSKIIYCKDCKYSHMTIDGLCKYCDIWFPNEEMYVDGKHFCASAEKRML